MKCFTPYSVTRYNHPWTYLEFLISSTTSVKVFTWANFLRLGGSETIFKMIFHSVNWSKWSGMTMSQETNSFKSSRGSAPDIICRWTQENGPAVGFQSDPDKSENPEMSDNRSSSSSSSGGFVEFGSSGFASNCKKKPRIIKLDILEDLWN